MSKINLVDVIPDFNDKIDGLVFQKGVKRSYPENKIRLIMNGVDKRGQSVYPMKIVSEVEKKKVSKQEN